jgi:GSCFA family/Polysaccharide biosynthesis enzyme WcbI
VVPLARERRAAAVYSAGTVKVFVTGACQAAPLASCLAVMMPAVRVETVPLGTDPQTLAGPEDVIVRQRSRRAIWSRTEPVRNEVFFPRIWFNAFHPDLVYVAGPAGPPPPPLGDYHSSLVLYGWQRGLGIEQTARLFCEAVYERLRFFSCWEPAKRALLEEGRTTGFALDELFARWERRGCFMHTTNHPTVGVLADLAREVVRRAGLAADVAVPESYLTDPMIHFAVWPVYPEIAERLGLNGSYAFKAAQPREQAMPALLDLEEFIARSFEAYAQIEPSALACPRLEAEAYRDLEAVASGRKQSSNGSAAPVSAPEPRARGRSPYAELPPRHFWRRAVERVPAGEVDPVGAPPFAIGRQLRIATAGSCFAQNMARVLERYGFAYFVAEKAPPELAPADARARGYGVFSTRCGNVYTARQLLQLFDRAYGAFVPDDDAWLRPDGRYADPFRPQIEPDGFATVEELVASREQHFAAVRAMFEQLDVLIFTLGLTEAWRSTGDGAVFPSAPGVVAGEMDASRYAFVNFTAAEVRDDLAAFLARLETVNARAKIVLTVSPQPPIATYEPRHVLVSATYTKAALRVAADEIERAHPNVWYFPGYELVANAFNRGAYFARDLRTVTPEGVEHVMRLFLSHCASEEQPPAEADAPMLAENRANFEVVCDEEVLAYEDGSGNGTLVAKPAADPADWPDYRRYLSETAPLHVPARTAPAAGRMDPLDRSAMRARVEATFPERMQARTTVTVRCAVTNAGDAALLTGEGHPVYLSYRWYDEHDAPAEVGNSIHTALPGALDPGASTILPMRIATPRHAGRYRLRVALLQSDIAWFDDVDPANGVNVRIDVAERVGDERPAPSGR